MNTWSPPPGCDLPRKKWLKPDLVERRRRRVGRDVAAHAHPRALRAVHHDGRVPSDPGPVAAFDVLVAGEPRLQLGRDGVDVVGRRQRGDGHPLFAGAFQQPQHQIARPRRPRSLQQVVERLQPLRRSPRDRCRADRTPRPRGSPEPGRVRLRCLGFWPDRGARTRWSTSAPVVGGLSAWAIVPLSCPLSCRTGSR